MSGLFWLNDKINHYALCVYLAAFCVYLWCLENVITNDSVRFCNHSVILNLYPAQYCNGFVDCPGDKHDEQNCGNICFYSVFMLVMI